MTYTDLLHDVAAQRRQEFHRAAEIRRLVRRRRFEADMRGFASRGAQKTRGTR